MARAPEPIRSAPSARFHVSTSSDSGCTAIMWSASGARRSIDASPLTATATGTRMSGRSQMRAESTSK